eukprot:scaffold899_cov168-Ochromonas_danica.AAC.2
MMKADRSRLLNRRMKSFFVKELKDSETEYVYLKSARTGKGEVICELKGYVMEKYTPEEAAEMLENFREDQSYFDKDKRTLTKTDQVPVTIEDMAKYMNDLVV